MARSTGISGAEVDILIQGIDHKCATEVEVEVRLLGDDLTDLEILIPTRDISLDKSQKTIPHGEGYRGGTNSGKFEIYCW